MSGSRKLGAGIIAATVLLALAPGMVRHAQAARTPRISVTGLPAFFELVLDATQNRVYASDPSGGRVFTLDGTDGHQISVLNLGGASWPEGMDISPDGSTLAVAAYGLHYVQLVNLADGSLGSTMVPQGLSPALPYDVKYGRAGRLYVADSTGANVNGYLHVMDTTTNLEVRHSVFGLQWYTRLAITADHNSLFVLQNSSGAANLVKFDVSTDNVDQPVEQGGWGSSGITLTTTPDGSKVFTNGGQAWDATLQHQLGTFQTL